MQLSSVIITLSFLAADLHLSKMRKLKLRLSSICKLKNYADDTTLIFQFSTVIRSLMWPIFYLSNTITRNLSAFTTIRFFLNEYMVTLY